MTLCFWTGAWVVTSVSGSVTASARSHWGNVVNGPLAPAEKLQIHFQLKTPWKVVGFQKSSN